MTRSLGTSPEPVVEGESEDMAGVSGEGSGWRDRRFGSIPEPLFQQEGRSHAVKPSASVTVQTEPFSRRPGAGVLVYPDQRQRLIKTGQSGLQTFAVATAVARLLGGPTGGIEREPHHQQRHIALTDESGDELQILGEMAPGHGGKRSDGETEAITAGESDAAPADIKGQSRPWTGRRHSALNQWRGNRAAPGLKALQHGPKPAGGSQRGMQLLPPPEAAGHEHHITMLLRTDLPEPVPAGLVAALAVKPELITGRGKTAQ